MTREINTYIVVRTVLTFVLFSLATMYSSAQTLRGVVKDDQGPMPGVSVLFMGTDHAAVTDLNGQFELTGLPLGNGSLEFSFFGYESVQIAVQVQPGVTVLDNPIELTGSTVINEVEIVAEVEHGEEKALILQKKNVNLTQVVSAEGIARLPDKNAAEALQRMPGVVMETDQGEGSFISFRGTPTDWGAALLNGDRLPVANEDDVGRAIDFEVLPTSLIEYINYNQNLSPDIEGDAIGGSANFITKYVPNKPTLNVQAGLGQNFKAMQPLWNLSVLAGDRFGEGDRWGVVGGGSVYQRNWSTDNYEIFYSNNNNHNIERLELRKYNGERISYGAHAKIDYNLDENNTIYALVFGSRVEDMEYNRKTMYNWVAGVGQSIVLQNIHNRMLNDLYGMNLGGNHSFGDDFHLDWHAASYVAKFGYGPSGQNGEANLSGYNVIEYEKLVRFQDYLYLDENGNQTDETNAYTRYRFLDIDSPIEGYGDPANNLNPRYEHIQAVKPEDTLFTHKKTYSEIREVYERDPFVLSADVTYDFSDELTFKIGGKMRFKEGYRSYSMVSWIRDAQNYNEALVYSDQNLFEIPRQYAYLQEDGGYYQGDVGTFLSDEDMQSWVSDHEQYLFYVPFGAKTTEIYQQFIGSNYTYDEQMYAGYLMANWVPNDRLKLNFGVRIEQTHVNIDAPNPNDTTYFDMNTGNVIVENWLENDNMNKSYTSVLPMVNLNYKLDEASAIRSAITRSFRRPNFNELKPGQPDIHYTHFHALYGNPDLKPTYAWNADLSYERYFGLSGVLTITGFYKYVTDHIYTAFRSDDMNVSGVSNVYRPPGGILAKEYMNAPYAHVGGFEITFQRKLTFLPWIFKNTSISLNYAYTASAMKIQAREELQPLPRQAKNVFNARLSYETLKVGFNVGLNYRDPYLMELNLIAVKDPNTGEAVVFNQNHDFDMYMGKSLGLDASVNYNVTEQLSVYLEANNLLNTPYVVYRGQVERPMQVEYYSIRALLGVRYNFFK